MKYDYGRKHIAKMTGLKGVEAGHIAKQLERQGLDYQSFDWQTIGGDLYGHGKRVGGVKSKLKTMYGVSIDKSNRDRHEEARYSDIEASALMPELMEINDRRSKKAKFMDWNRQAHNTFKPTNKAGVRKWKKNPNRYDIIGIDDKI